MKTRTFVQYAVTFSILSVIGARAQTIQTIIMGKEIYFTQTTNTTAMGVNFQFSGSIEGSSLSGITTPTYNSNSMGGTGSTGPFGYNSTDDAWYIEQNFGTLAALNGAYPHGGNLSLTVQGETFLIALPADSPGPFTPIPLATLSAGTISGGVLTWDVSQPLTISLIDPLNASFASVDHISLSIFGPNIDLSSDAFGNATQSFTIPATAGVNNSFVAGQSYVVETSFVNIAGSSSPSTFSSGALTGVQYGGIFGRTANFTIQAIPEPSTYAALAGAAALLAAASRRRRKQVHGS